MKLTGNRILHASPEAIFALLMDTDVLTRITPGITQLKETGPDEYDAIADVKIGPVSGSFKGKVNIKDKKENQGFTLAVVQNSKIGNVSADVAIALQPVDNQKTEMSFQGLAKMSGLLARTGQRVLSGVANTLTKQFFSALEQELVKAA